MHSPVFALISRESQENSAQAWLVKFKQPTYKIMFVHVEYVKRNTCHALDRLEPEVIRIQKQLDFKDISNSYYLVVF